jgi:hypothetical protein
MASHRRAGRFVGNRSHYDGCRFGLGFTGADFHQSTSGIVVFVQASVSIRRLCSEICVPQR